MVIVRNVDGADLRIQLDRPVFTYTFTFSMTHVETSALLANGDTIAFDGNLAAPKLAKSIVRVLAGARKDQAER